MDSTRPPVASASSSLSPFGYAGGRYQEDATGLKLLGHRYYDPTTGRFLTRDPARDGRNWYIYCDNNPTGAVDPSGLTWYYDQGSGDLWWDDPSSIAFDPRFVGRGAAGKGKHRNNPDSQTVKNWGPLPRGRYRMDFGHSRSPGGRAMRGGCIWLTPDASNEMFGRSHFLIHGWGNSQGCIMIDKDIRDQIEESGDENLIVCDSGAIEFPILTGPLSPGFTSSPAPPITWFPVIFPLPMVIPGAW